MLAPRLIVVRCSGEMVRTREMNAAQHGGAPCVGAANEAALCNEHACPTNCTWNSWGAWGPCSLDCGGGTQALLFPY